MNRQTKLNPKKKTCTQSRVYANIKINKQIIQFEANKRTWKRLNEFSLHAAVWSCVILKMRWIWAWCWFLVPFCLGQCYTCKNSMFNKKRMIITSSIVAINKFCFISVYTLQTACIIEIMALNVHLHAIRCTTNLAAFSMWSHRYHEG